MSREWRREFPKTIVRDGVAYDVLMSTPASRGWNAAVYVQRDRQLGSPRADNLVIVCIVDRSNRSHEERHDVKSAIEWLLSNMIPAEWGEIERQEHSLDRMAYFGGDMKDRLGVGAEAVGRVKDAVQAMETMLKAAERLYDMRSEPDHEQDER